MKKGIDDLKFREGWGKMSSFQSDLFSSSKKSANIRVPYLLTLGVHTWTLSIKLEYRPTVLQTLILKLFLLKIFQRHSLFIKSYCSSAPSGEYLRRGTNFFAVVLFGYFPASSVSCDVWDSDISYPRPPPSCTGNSGTFLAYTHYFCEY